MWARVIVVALVGTALASAATAESARDILDRQRALDRGERRWTDRREEVAMEVLDPRRAPRHLRLSLFDKKTGESQRTMVYFTAPDSVKGTAFLAITHPDRAADQWLYLPEAKRARRIGGAVRHQGFVGTDFSYHDLDLLAAMPGWTEADASASLRGDAVVDGVPCHVIELTPRREDIGYALIVLWLGRDDLVPRQVELYETAPRRGWFGGTDGGAPTRRVRQSDVRSIDRIPVPHRVEVETPASGTKTVVTFSGVAFDQGLPDDLFTQPALERGGFP